MAINTTGAAFFNPGGDFSGAPGSTGTLTIMGGTYYATHGDVAINFNGSGNSSVTGMLTLTSTASLIVEPNSSGRSPSIDVGSSFDPGYQASGTLLIESGSVLDLRNTAIFNPSTGYLQGGYGDMTIGRGADGSGMATVTGAGSQVITSGGAPRITVGRDSGYGRLDIEQGGFVGTFNVTAGRDGGIGHVNVTGAGSELKTSSAYGSYAGSSFAGATGYSSIGRGDGSKGYLTITNGGTVNIENEDGISDAAFLRFGRDYGSYGYGLISGSGSSLNIAQIGLADQAPFNYGSDLLIGHSGLGKLIVEQNAQVTVTGDEASIIVGLQRGSQAITPGQNLLEVRSGGDVLIDAQGYTGAFLTVGSNAGTDGKLTISGVGSTVTVENDLDDSLEASEFAASVLIGRNGSGELYIEDGGRLTIDGADDRFPILHIGRGLENGQTVASGVATVTGAGSVVEIIGSNTSAPGTSGGVIVGRYDNADGELNILNGGRVSLTGPNSFALIGDDPGSEGNVLVSGAGSVFELRSGLNVGVDSLGGGVIDPVDGGLGSLTIANGGMASARFVNVGARGVLDVDGGTLVAQEDVELWGRMEIGRDSISAATFDLGSGLDFLDFHVGSSLVIDVEGFAPGQADFATFIGNNDNVDTRLVPFILDLDPTLAVSAGDQIAIAEWTGTLNARDRVIYDQNRGLEFSIEQQGNQLVLVAREDSVDFSLAIGETETGSFGNGFDGATDADGIITASFLGVGEDITFTFDGYDIDSNAEVELFLNGVSQGFLAAGPNNGLQAQSFTLAAADQVSGQNILRFEQQDNPAFKWGFTDLLLEASPADFTLAAGVTESGSFGNGFNGATDADGSILGTFQGTGDDLLLTFDGFDIDSNAEVELFLNGTSLGFLTAGPNNGLQAQSFGIAAADQVAGVNELRFEQQDNPAFKWGFTDLLLDAPSGDFALTVGETDTNSYGNGFNGATDADGSITAGFIGRDSDLILDFEGYDIDNGGEVEVLLNGTSQGFLTPGPNNGEQRQQFVIEAGDQQEGANLLAFEQRDNPAFKWGFTEVTLEDARDVDQALALDRMETSPFGNGFNGATEADGSITFGFAGTDEDLDFTFQGFDIDHGGEVELFLNDVSQGFLATGPNNGLQAQAFAIAAADQVDGLNELRFEQQDNPAFRWGVTDLLLEIA